MNFAEYLKSFKNENSPFGDLSKDFIISKSKAKTYKGVKSNLEKNHACQSAFNVLDKVYIQYLKTLGE